MINQWRKVGRNFDEALMQGGEEEYESLRAISDTLYENPLYKPFYADCTLSNILAHRGPFESLEAAASRLNEVLCMHAANIGDIELPFSIAVNPGQMGIRICWHCSFTGIFQETYGKRNDAGLIVFRPFPVRTPA